MFVEAKLGEFDSDWAAVTKAWRSEATQVGPARRHRLLVTTTVCTADMGESLCQRVRGDALARGVNILLDDYVRPTPGRAHHLDLGHETVAGIPAVAAGSLDAAGAGPGG